MQFLKRCEDIDKDDKGGRPGCGDTADRATGFTRQRAAQGYTGLYWVALDCSGL